MNKYKGQVVLSINAKYSDAYSHTIYTKEGKVYREYDGYVPSFMPGQHFGDYIELDINPYAGKILNWKPASKKKGKEQ